MGTVVTIDLYTTVTDDISRRQLNGACAVLHEADAVFSTWRADSALSRLRRGELDLTRAPRAVVDVLDRCVEAARVSDGWFDPWSMTGGVDPTGYVKGWAAEKALSELFGPGTVGAMVNAAGDIATFGSPGIGGPFRVGIVDPFDRGRLAYVIEVPHAVATSGTYERGNHLVDPHTGQAVARLASASVCGPDLGLADALATALAVAGPDGLAFIDRLDGYEAMAIGFDRQWWATPGFPFDQPGRGRFVGDAYSDGRTLVGRPPAHGALLGRADSGRRASP